LVSALIDRNWALPAILPIRHEDRVVSVVFSPDGSRVLSASWDKTAQVHNAITGASLLIVHHQGAVLDARYNPIGDRFVTAFC
jgi:WD40 repeat protein